MGGVVLTAGADVTQVSSGVGVQCEAPWRLHLAAGVPAEVVASPELWVLDGGEVVAVWVLAAPRLALVTRPGEADRAPVVGTGAVVTAVVCGRNS